MKVPVSPRTKEPSGGMAGFSMRNLTVATMQKAHRLATFDSRTSSIGRSRFAMYFRQRIRNLSLPYTTNGNLEQSTTTTTDRPKHIIGPQSTKRLSRRLSRGSETRHSKALPHQLQPIDGLLCSNKAMNVMMELLQASLNPLLLLVEIIKELVRHVHHDSSINIFAYDNQTNQEILSAAGHKPVKASMSQNKMR